MGASHKPDRNVICLVVDRLGAGALGCYGNTWIETPEIDRLASRSFLFDHATTDSPRLESIYGSMWQSLPTLATQDSGSQPTLFDLLADAGFHTTLLTDEAALVSYGGARHSLAESFHQQVILSAVTGDASGEGCVAAAPAAGKAPGIEQTQMAQLFATAVDLQHDAAEPFVLWLHARGMSAPWDAPLEFRNQFADKLDPTPPETAEVPCRMLPPRGHPDYDPDELLGISQAYAGQVSLLDHCLGALLDDFFESPLAERTLLVFLSSRGFPLGEHRRVGEATDLFGRSEALYGETVHIPWLMLFPDTLGAPVFESAGVRTQALVQPIDLGPTLLDWLGLDAPSQENQLGGGWGKSLMPLVRGEVSSVHDRVCMFANRHERAIRVPEWHMRVSVSSTTGMPNPIETTELYSKPDDRWEVNEISKFFPDEIESLRDALDQYSQASQSPRPVDFPPLAEPLG